MTVSAQLFQFVTFLYRNWRRLVIWYAGIKQMNKIILQWTYFCVLSLPVEHSDSLILCAGYKHPY